MTEAFPWDQAPRYLIRDLDSSYGAVVTHRIQAMGIRDRATAPRSPWQNGHIERLIGSIRRECLDHRVRKCLAPSSAPQSAEEGWARCRSSHLTDKVLPH
jgi:transposase InsO family protein